MTTRQRNKIKDLWSHPVGHELLLPLLQKNGQSVAWIESPWVANLPATMLDRYAFPGFAHFVTELCSPCFGEMTGETNAWWKDSVFYQIFVPSFMDSDHDGLGDFGGILQRLPYLSRLGVNTLWLCPVLSQGAEGGISDHRALHKDLGNKKNFQQLLSAVHGLDMRLVMDINFSCVSPQHHWFKAVAEGGGHPEYFHWKPGPPPWEATLTEKNWHYVPTQEAFCLMNKGRMALNWDCGALRHEFVEILRFWLELGVDGFCIGGLGDLFWQMHVSETDSPKLLPERGWVESHHLRLQQYLRELRISLPQPDCLLLGKMNGRYVNTQTRLFACSKVPCLNLLYSSGHLYRHPKDPVTLSLQHFRRHVLAYHEMFGNEAFPSLFWNNHKHPRVLSRLSSCASYHNLLSKLLATWLLCMRGTPVLYQGDELGLFSPCGEENGVLSAQAPFPWNGDKNAGFSGTTPWLALPQESTHLHATGQMVNPRSVWQHHAKLIALRKQYPCLVHGSFKPVFTNNTKLLCFFRILGNEKCYIELSLCERQIARPGRISQQQHLLLSNYESTSKYLRPYEANVYLCDTT